MEEVEVLDQDSIEAIVAKKELDDAVAIPASDEELDVEAPEVSAIEVLRNIIATEAGESDSLQGKAWDLQEVLLVTIMNTFTKLSKANDIVDVREAIDPSTALFFESILGQIASGDLVLTYQAKGLSETDVVSETVETIAKLSTVFKSAS